MKEGNHKYGVAGRTWSLAGKARFQVRGSALHSLSDSLGTLRPQRLAASLSDRLCCCRFMFSCRSKCRRPHRPLAFASVIVASFGSTTYITPSRLCLSSQLSHPR